MVMTSIRYIPFVGAYTLVAVLPNFCDETRNAVSDGIVISVWNISFVNIGS
jgi:hypothetical protein